jgi:hypothetical protein
MGRALTVAWLCCAATACASSGYTGAARELSAAELRAGGGWLAIDGVPELRQRAGFDCGPTALAMVLGYWFPSAPASRWVSGEADLPVKAGTLRDRAQATGLASFVLSGTFKDVAYELSRKRPVIALVAKPTAQGRIAHYQVIVGLHVASRRLAVLDPQDGLRQNTFKGFLKEWQPTGRLMVVVLPRQPATLALALEK